MLDFFPLSTNFQNEYVSVLTFCGSYNTSLQIWWLTLKIYSFTVLEIQSLKSVSLGQNQDVGRAVLLPQILVENLFLYSSSFWCLLVFLCLWPYHTNLFLCLHITLMPSVCQIFFYLLLGYLWWHLAHLDNSGLSHLQILNYNHILQRPFFLIK